MSIAESLLPEFDMEIEATRNVLAAVPGDKLDWQPHEKSMTLGQLASHVAEVPMWVEGTMQNDFFDMNPADGEPYTPFVGNSTDAILGVWDDAIGKARAAIAATEDGAFMQEWSFKNAGETMFSAPKIGVYRRFIMNHLLHHRGQLTVYLRLAGAAVPQTLGPTADFPDM